MTAPATTAAALLELMAMMAYRHPTSTSTSEASAVLGVCMRSSQRHLNRLRNIGLTESDGECPAGWRLTPKALDLLTMRRCSMTRNSVYFSVLEKPSRPRPSHEQLADELAGWLAQGNRIQQLPVSQSQQWPGNWKAQEKLKGRVK